MYLTYPTHFHRLFKLTKLNYFAGRFGNKTIKFFFYSFHDHTINATKDEIRHLNKQDLLLNVLNIVSNACYCPTLLLFLIKCVLWLFFKNTNLFHSHWRIIMPFLGPHWIFMTNTPLTTTIVVDPSPQMGIE